MIPKLVNFLSLHMTVKTVMVKNRNVFYKQNSNRMTSHGPNVQNINISSGGKQKLEGRLGASTLIGSKSPLAAPPAPTPPTLFYSFSMFLWDCLVCICTVPALTAHCTENTFLFSQPSTPVSFLLHQTDLLV